MDPFGQLESSLDGLENSRLLVAMGVAFGLIAASDAKVAEDEVTRALEILVRGIAPAYRDAHGAKSLSPAKTGAMEAALRTLFEHLVRDFDGGRARALGLIADFAGSRDEAEQIVAAAQAAIVADGSLVPREEVALRDVCAALGLDPADR